MIPRFATFGTAPVSTFSPRSSLAMGSLDVSVLIILELPANLWFQLGCAAKARVQNRKNRLPISQSVLVESALSAKVSARIWVRAGKIMGFVTVGGDCAFPLLELEAFNRAN